MSTPRLSIVIVSYNNSKLIEQCLDSIYLDSNSKNWGIIVVDNFSKDDTVSMLDKKFPNVKLIANTKNVGFAKANNQALRICKGEKILLLNNDTIVVDDAISKMIDFLDNNDSVGLLGPRLLNQDGSVQVQGSLLGPHFWKSIIPTETKFLRGAALMTKKIILDEVGLLDEKFFFYNEDIDYCWRVLQSGYKVVFFPEAEIIHYGGKMSLKRQLMGLQGTLYLWSKILRGSYTKGLKG